MIIISVLYGAARGFIYELFSMIGFAASIIIARKYYVNLAEFLIHKTKVDDILLGFIEKNKITEAFSTIEPLEKGLSNIYQYITLVIMNCISIFLIFIAARICISLLEALLKEVFKLPVLSNINHSLGALLGFARAILILIFFYAMLMPLASLEKFLFIHEAMTSSLLSKYFYKYNFIFNWALNTALNIFIS